MTNEQKQLLLKDLCAELQHGLKLKTPHGDAILSGIINRKGFRKDTDYIDIVTDKQTYLIQYVKPYLRPMSSMTEEEAEEYCDLQDKFLYSSQYPVTDAYELFDWLNARHFDYRGLIPIGLALEAPENMYV